MALLGQVHRETYRKPRRRRDRQHYRRRERKRITKIEKSEKGGYKQILAATYIEGTRRAKRLELYSGNELAIIELQEDGTRTITHVHPTPTTRKIANYSFNQRSGTLTWCELDDDGVVGPEQKVTIESPILSTAALLLFFPIGWFLLPFRSQLNNISQSWNSLLDSATDAYSER